MERHKCGLPGCEVMTKNRVYCSKACADLGKLRDSLDGEKRCKNCKKDKPVSEFVHRDKQGHMRTRKWCRECCDALPQEAKDRRAETANRKRREETAMQETIVAALKQRDWSPIMVDATGRFPAITLDQLVLGGLPGTSTSACPFAA